MKKQRILTGDRTTGRLHLGHYVGSLENRVRLQNDYETFVLLADIQALTTHFKSPEILKDSIYQVAMDNLSVGLDPDKVTFIQQSQVPAIAELTIFYSMFVSVNALRHNPTVKTEALQYGYDELTYGFLGYPVSQAADITFCKADLVPVGEDQLPHMEQTRKIVRRFNELYGKGSPILKEPQALLSETPRLIGLDGNSKMGKSLGNAIYLSDSQDVVAKKVNSAITDPNRIRISDRGNPEICSVYKYHKTFNQCECDNIGEMCREGKVGCSACKRQLVNELSTLLDPIRERRSYYENHTHQVRDIILQGTNEANKIGNKTVQEIKNLMNLDLN